MTLIFRRSLLLLDAELGGPSWLLDVVAGRPDGDRCLRRLVSICVPVSTLGIRLSTCLLCELDFDIIDVKVFSYRSKCRPKVSRGYGDYEPHLMAQHCLPLPIRQC